MITSRGKPPLFGKILKNELSMARLERTRKELPENGRMMAGSSRFGFSSLGGARVAEMFTAKSVQFQNFVISTGFGPLGKLCILAEGHKRTQKNIAGWFGHFGLVLEN